MQTFWNDLDYHIVFDNDAELRRLSNPIALRRFPDWVDQGQFESSSEFHNGRQLTATEGLLGIAESHHFAVSGTRVIKLIVGGQLTLRGPIQRVEVNVSIDVRDRPSLSDVIGHVTFRSQSQPAYVNETVRFVYAVENAIQNVSYCVDFGDELQMTVRIDRFPNLFIYAKP